MGVTAQLGASQIFSFVLHNHLFEQVILFVPCLLIHLLGAWGLTSFLRRFHVIVQVFEINLVTVLVFKGMQTSIRALFEQELTQVRRRDKVVRLWLVAAAITVVALPLLPIILA